MCIGARAVNSLGAKAGLLVFQQLKMDMCKL